VLFDVGHGGGSFTFALAEPMVKGGFFPDSISTDLHVGSATGVMLNLPNVMNKILALGVPLNYVSGNPGNEVFLAFRGYGEMGLYANSAPVDVIIATWPWGAYLGDESAGKGIRAKVSSWRRNSPGGAIPHAKASGSYLNSILAKTESANAGYDEAILLDERGFVSEGSGENIFVVREGEILTPPHTASILDGINRKSVIQIARDLGYTVVERDIARAELYLAEEVFLTGTAAELVPVREIDDHPLGEPGEITRHVQAKFEDALCGRAEEYLEWLDFVEAPSEVDAGDRVGS